MSEHDNLQDADGDNLKATPQDKYEINRAKK